MIEFYQLEYLVAIDKEGSLSKASLSLHVSQPALTRAMQNLEADLGLTLFDRSKNRMILNENGKEMLIYAKDSLRLIDNMEARAKAIKEEAATLSISLCAPGPLYKYPGVLSPSGSKKIIVSIDSNESIIKGVKLGSLDLGFINETLDDSELSCLPLFKEKLSLWLPKNHFLVKKGNATFREADGQSFLLSRNLGAWEEIVRKEMPSSKFYEQSFENLSEIVNASSIPAFVTDVTEFYRENEDRVAVPLLDDSATMSFYLIFRKEKRSRYPEIEELLLLS